MRAVRRAQRQTPAWQTWPWAQAPQLKTHVAVYVHAPLHTPAPAGHGHAPETAVLGTAIFDGERPQIEIPPNAWQRARCLGAWTLVGCTVSPAFEFSKFEIAGDGFTPPKS